MVDAEPAPATAACLALVAALAAGCAGDLEAPERPFEGHVHPELAAHSAEFERGVIEVTDGVHVAIGFGLANSILLEGRDGVVVVDTMTGRTEAEAVRREFAGITGKPVAAVVLTHNHADHIFGGKVFTGGDPAIPVYAHAATESYIDRFVNLINDGIYVRSVRMFGPFLTPEEVENAGIGPALAYDPQALALARPTHVFDDRLDVEVAGIRMTLVHAPGETPDQLFVWLPEKKVLLPGDNVYRAFPNLYTIRGTPYRDVMDWVRSLDAMRALEPEFLVPSHTRPVAGRERIADVLTAYRDAIQFVHDQTIRGINKGLTPDELVEVVRLPPHLAEHPWLREHYGTVAWSVRNVFGGYLGWFGGDAETLDRLPPAERSRRFAAAVEAGRPLAEQAREAVAAGDFLWAAELAGHLRRSRPGSKEARMLQAAAFEALGERHVSANGRHYYLTRARELQGKLEIQPAERSLVPDDFIRDLPIASFMHALPVRLKAEKALDEDTVVAFRFTDVEQDFTVHVRRGVAAVELRRPADPDLSITVPAEVWKAIAFGKTSPAAAFARGDLEVDGGVLAVVSFLRLFDR